VSAPSSALLLQQAWQQCQRHWHHMQYALQALRPHLPVSPQSLADLDDEQVQDWDQFILRFTKLQDAMGSQLYPALLAHLQEPYEDRPMLDKLHRLEKLGYLSDVQEWNVLRGIRNRLTHDYPTDNALKAAYLNDAVDAVTALAKLLKLVESQVPAA
jgi:hypothetical protein